MRGGRASNVLRIARRTAAYAWAGPNTLLGLAAGLAVLASGGRARTIGGTLEFSGGCLAWLLAVKASFPFCAITFGHVILGISASDLEAVRSHEHAHVAQYEAWGPLFLPAYVGSSVWQWLRRRHAYRENYFERQAFARSEAR